MIANVIANNALARGVKNVASQSSDFVAPDLGATDNGDFNEVKNPYRDQLENGSYKLSFWDKLGNKLGFNTKEDSYRIELERLAREFDANLQIQDAVNKYNSESSQAQRQRAAGFNPDLNGVSSESATSSVPTSPDSSSLASVEAMTTSEEVMPIVSTLSSVVTTAFGNASGLIGLFQNLNQRKLANDASALNNIQNAYDFGYKQSQLGFKTSDIQNIIDKTDLSQYDLVDGSYVHKKTGELLIPDSLVSANYDDFIDKFGLRNNRNTKRYFNAFRKGHKDYINGQIGKLKQNVTENALTAERVTSKKNSVLGFDPSNIDKTFEPIVPYLKDSFKLGYETDMLSLRFNSLYLRTKNAVALASNENAENEYGQKYYSSLDASLAALNENTSNEVSSQYWQTLKGKNFGKLSAEIDTMRKDIEQMVLKWQYTTTKNNERLARMFGDDNFMTYIMQSILGDINGNIFQRVNQWQTQTLNRLGQISNIISPFTSSTPSNTHGYTF